MHDENEYDIAIVGMAGRFPGADNIDEFWQNLVSGKESISILSDDEIIKSGVDPAVLDDPNYIKAAPILNRPDMFDAAFFGYSPREAESMDPQQRLFLECAWEALEHAGCNPDSFKGPIGVYGGAAMNTYLLFSGLLPNFVTHYLPTLIGSDNSFLTTRVSYKMNLKGPSVTVQTACSTSLVAVHTACQSLLNGECDMALAGGVSVRVPHHNGYIYQEGSVFTPDGHCRPFDAKAQGTIFGSGVGIVVLRPLADAIASGNSIYAVIKGSAINNDGASKTDYTAPSVNSQSEAIVEALANSGVDADTISYIEAHGTGTYLGDPIEITALTRAFRTYTDKKGYCRIGSVKSNVGHLDAAAGIAGLIKTVMALKNEEIPASLHFEESNPEIDFPNSPFFVNSSLSDWKRGPRPRRAGISSLGIGGTNAHVILEEAPQIETSQTEKTRPAQLLLLSAKTATALDAATTNLAEHLKRAPELNLADAAYTLQTGRKAFDHRRMLVVNDIDDAATALQTQGPVRVLTTVQEASNRDIAFMFTGQGAQYVNMGLELYKSEAEFRTQVDHCSELLIPHLGLDIRDILYPDEKDSEEATRSLRNTFITQPALFVIEYALARLWMSWGIQPAACVGHSIGEYVAACLSGVFELKDALALVAARGRLMQELPTGSMLSVPLPEEDIRPLLGEHLSLAVINGPSRCVVSGEQAAVEDLAKRLSDREVDCRPLQTSHAFHSPMMDPILKTFTERVAQVPMNLPGIPFVSNVTGTWITHSEAMDPEYWSRHLRQTVRFSDCVQSLLKEPNRVLLEVGPGNTLRTLARQHVDKSLGHIVLSSVRHPKEQKSDVAFLLSTLGQLWLAGVQIDWAGFYANEKRYQLPLPTYPFDRQRHWFESSSNGYRDKSSLSLKESQTPVFNLLNSGNTERLADQLSSDGKFSEEEMKLLPGILDMLSKLHRKQLGIASIKDLIYEIEWQPQAHVDQESLEIPISAQGNWLILADTQGIGLRLSELLIARGEVCTLVFSGSSYEQISEQSFRINPDIASDFGSLLDAIRVNNVLSLRGVVHLWSIDSAESETLTGETLEAAFQMGCGSTLHLVQALIRAEMPEPPSLWIVSRGAQPVGEKKDVPGLAQSPLWGMGKVIALEHPELNSVQVDLDPATGIDDVRPLFDEIWSLKRGTNEDQVAFRENARYVARLVAAGSKFNGFSSQQPLAFHSEKTYMITGGLGGLGMLVARWMVERGARNLMLVGRRGSTNDAGSKLKELEKSGAQIVVAQADVSSHADVVRLLADINKSMPPLKGIFHAAMVLDDGVILNQTKERFERVMAPKVEGAWNLHTLTQDMSLDFFVVSSSAYSLMGYPGQANYTAANTFLDSLAHYRQARGLPGLTVNWGFMEGIGTAVRQAIVEEQKRMKAAGFGGISPEQGFQILEQAFLHPVVQVGMLSVDWARFTKKFQSAHIDETDTPAELPYTERIDYLHELESASEGDRYSLLIAYLQERVADALGLGVSQLDAQQPLNTMGLDSLMAVGLRNRFKTDLGVDISMEKFINGLSVANLAMLFNKSGEEIGSKGEVIGGEL